MKAGECRYGNPARRAKKLPGMSAASLAFRMSLIDESRGERL
ncbi:MAG TPA: hypothetical protein VEX70_07185 [Pyrinomonadaceae bacterium]|nr:hypothetical protein [Pyrinomonadaceae bacterium]